MSLPSHPKSRALLACCATIAFSPFARAQETTPVAPDPNPILQLPAPPVPKVPVTPSPLAEQIEKITPNLIAPTIATPTIKATTAPVKIVEPNKNFSGESLAVLTKRLNLPLPLPQGRIIVSKSARRLELWNGATLVKSYRVSLGANPVGHKQTQGDNRTPEGSFRICTRNDKTSAFHVFLGLNYPNVPDAQRGLKNKQITAREYQLIRQRLASRGAPLWRTPLGGWVGIHGGSDAAYAKRISNQRGHSDWTAGCIALTNREIEELHRATKMGTEVLVRP